MSYNVAIMGATGLVGKTMLSIVEQRDFPIDKMFLLASADSAGTTLKFCGQKIEVRDLAKFNFKREKINYVLSAVEAATSAVYSPIAAASGAVVIDNSSHFRMQKGIPLVVPEVNPRAAFCHHGIIANPNCSTIQMVVALKPLEKKYGIKRVVVSTYQAVSGAGKAGIKELQSQMNGIHTIEEFPVSILGNVIPQIDTFTDEGQTKEELKMINETRKIMGRSIRVSATCVRVPVLNGHCESVNIETLDPIESINSVELSLKYAPGIICYGSHEIIVPERVSGTDQVHVGRIRRDKSLGKHGLDMFVVADNVRKGAALNAVQIAELLIGRQK